MAARASLHSLLSPLVLAPDGELAALGFTSVYGSNSIDTPTDEKFVVVRWGAIDPAFKDRGAHRVTIWFHDRNQDYLDITEAMRIVKGVLEDAIHVTGADGWTLTQADWRGDSEDLIDDGFKTQTRNSAYDVVSRYDTA